MPFSLNPLLLQEPYGLIFVIPLGLCLGSFATALIYRIPKNIPWVYGTIENSGGIAARSQCPNCHKNLNALDLVPLFSWLFSRGQCRHCHQKIPSFYPLVELSVLILTLIMFLSWGLTVTGLIVLLTIPFLFSALVIDWQHMILPDSINISLLVVSVMYGVSMIMFGNDVAVFPWLFDHILAGLLLPLLFWFVAAILSKIKGKDALGGGDIKFLVPSGLFLGLASLPSFLVVSGVLGLLTAIIKAKGIKTGVFPFGPALIISLYLHLFLTGIGFDSRG